jgi:hypothetical protein
MMACGGIGGVVVLLIFLPKASEDSVGLGSLVALMVSGSVVLAGMFGGAFLLVLLDMSRSLRKMRRKEP